ncbi:MAG TPA: hypothetical protein VFT67_06580 [Jatrophihabitantaceae bacterium]|nr:hypothetical protein [Jatrophihabitantaceae bacterium]
MTQSARRCRALAACALLLAAVGITGCARTVNGTASAPSVDLGKRLQHSMDTVTSAHVEMRVDSGGLFVVASGDQKLNHAKPTAFSLTEHIGGLGEIKVIDADGKLYVHLPAHINPTAKPWVLIRPDTTDPTLAPLAQALQQVQQSTSLRQYAAFAQSASNFHDVGRSEANGIQAELYTFDVLISRLPQNLPGAAVLRRSGIHSLPVKLWVDDQGRVRRMSETISMAGQQTSTRVDLSKFDVPVTISAPPPDQVATR